MNVIISPNLHKQTDRINVNGDYVDPKTKQVISKAEPTPVVNELSLPPIETKNYSGSSVIAQTGDYSRPVIEEKHFNFCPNCGHRL